VIIVEPEISYVCEEWFNENNWNKNQKNKYQQ
jgi:hypothetical protein